VSSQIDYMDEGIVRVRLTGPQTLADYRKQTEDALQLAKSKKVALFMVVDQQARNTASVLELFAMPAMYVELGAPRSAKAAIVMPHNSPSAADIRFYERPARQPGTTCGGLVARQGFDADGSPTRARTWDLRINSPSLYRLSYRGSVKGANCSGFPTPGQSTLHRITAVIASAT
jgi:hypothetical protein